MAKKSIQMCHEILRTRAHLSTDQLLCLAPEDNFDFGMDFESLEDFFNSDHESCQLKRLIYRELPHFLFLDS